MTRHDPFASLETAWVSSPVKNIKYANHVSRQSINNANHASSTIDAAVLILFSLHALVDDYDRNKQHKNNNFFLILDRQNKSHLFWSSSSLVVVSCFCCCPCLGSRRIRSNESTVSVLLRLSSSRSRRRRDRRCLRRLRW